jgi:hypothetical protein
MSQQRNGSWYGWIIVPGACLCGLLYAGSFFITEIQIIIEKHITTDPLILALVQLFCAGATFGYAALSAMAPTAYLRRNKPTQGRMGTLPPRLIYAAFAAFIGYVTVVVVHLAYSG